MMAGVHIPSVLPGQMADRFEALDDPSLKKEDDIYGFKAESVFSKIGIPKAKA